MCQVLTDEITSQLCLIDSSVILFAGVIGET